MSLCISNLPGRTEAGEGTFVSCSIASTGVDTDVGRSDIGVAIAGEEAAGGMGEADEGHRPHDAAFPGAADWENGGRHAG